jgi:hypothetical protein
MTEVVFSVHLEPDQRQSVADGSRAIRKLPGQKSGGNSANGFTGNLEVIGESRLRSELRTGW